MSAVSSPVPRQLRPGLWWTLDSPPRVRRLDLVLVLALCLLAYAVRLYQLDARSLWSDEGLTVRRISLSMGEIITNRMPIDNVVTQDLHPALYFILMKLFREITGPNLFALKFVSVVWSVLLVPLFFATGRALLSARAGRAAALLAALSPIYLWYAQDLRMYTQLAALSLLAVYTLVRASEQGRWWRWMLAGLATVALCYTHYTGLLVALFEVVTLAIITYHVGRARRFIALALALLSTVPLIILAFPRALTGFEPNYSFVPLDTILRDLLNSFSLGISVKVDQVWWLDEIFLVVLALGVIAGYAGGQRSRWLGARWLLLGYLLLPVLGYYLLSYVKPAYQGVRHLFIVSPAFYLLVARGIDILASRLRLLTMLVLITLVGGMAFSTDQYFTNPKYMKDDWRALVRYVEANAWPRDVVLVNNSLLRPVLDAYSEGDGLTWLSAPEQGLNLGVVTDTLIMSGTLAELRELHPRIWLVAGPPEDNRDPNAFVREWLQQNTTFLGSQKFPGRSAVISVSLYSTAPTVQDLPPTGIDVPAAEMRWQGGPQLLGYKLRTPGYLVGGSMLPVQLAWYAPEPLDPARRFWVHLSAIDPAGTVVASVEEPLVAGGAFEWPPDKWLLSGHTLFIPPGAPPGQYQVQVVLLVPQGTMLDVIPLASGETAANLSQIPVYATFALPDARRMPNFTPQKVRFETGVELVGYRVTGVALRPGQPIAVQLCWRALRSAPPDGPVVFEMVDAFGRPVASGTGTLSSPDYATRGWQKGQIVMSTVTIRLAGQVAEGWYRFRIEMPGAQAYTELWPFPRRQVELGPVQVTAWPWVTELPPGVTPSGARFGDGVTLAGYQVEGDRKPGGLAAVTLYWRVDKNGTAAAADLVAYAHLVPNAGGSEPVLHDSIPGDAQRPADTWRAGEIIVDRHVLRLTADFVPGSYPVFAGLYHGGSGARWPVTVDGVRQANDELHLFDLSVGAK